MTAAVIGLLPSSWLGHGTAAKCLPPDCRGCRRATRRLAGTAVPHRWRGRPWRLRLSMDRTGIRSDVDRASGLALGSWWGIGNGRRSGVIGDHPVFGELVDAPDRSDSNNSCATDPHVRRPNSASGPTGQGRARRHRRCHARGMRQCQIRSSLTMPFQPMSRSSVRDVQWSVRTRP